MKKILLLPVFLFAFLANIMAQDPAVAETKAAPKQKFTRAVFNATKIINMQSTEIVSPGAIQFMISHHFSNIWNKGGGKQNIAQFFGLNSGVAHTYMSFDYSPLKFMNVGVAMAGASKYEGWAKFRILRQQTGAKNIPVTIGWYSMMNVNTAEDPDNEFSGNKFSFMNQLLISRKFSDKISLQLMPTWIHFNVVPYGINNSNEVFSMGIAGKYKVSSKLNVTLEYARQLNMYKNLITKNGAILNYNPDLLSLGVEISTGTHLFQFYVGSTTDASAIDQLARNNSSIKDGNIAFGFTINRSMNVKKKEK
ncbi:MAG: hypothetical protein IPN43_04815 [Chitinophagaceae bacterium]|nr:hypothetical protein [Chitinophagaceae bacterium]MBL0199701.1 hypothetical protein [Chitinophagaceae bacterium]